MGKTVKMADKSNDNRHWSVRDMLEEAIKFIDEGKIEKPTKAFLVIMEGGKDLDEASANYFKAGMSSTHEVVGILEISKADTIFQLFKGDS